VSLIDRLAQSAQPDAPRTLTLLLVRDECRPLLERADIVHERQTIVAALEAVRFRGAANMAAGLEAATALARRDVATLLIALNASSPYAGRSGAAAIHEMHRVVRVDWQYSDSVFMYSLALLYIGQCTI
jgi:hypothetical protein